MEQSMTTPVMPEFLSGGGEMGQRMRDFDWSQTALGPVHTWPQSLRTCVRIMLTSRQPIWIGWGKEWIKLYNDPYKAIVGGKHPWALGAPANVVWREIWDHIDPLYNSVMNNDEGTYEESQLLIMERNGYPEETYYTFSYTPIPGDNGGTAGMICANTDDTDRIISQRQLKTLTRLGKNLANSLSNEEVISKTIESLVENKHDFTYVLFYVIDGDKATLSGNTDLGSSAHMVPSTINLQENNDLAEVARQAVQTREIQLLREVHKSLGVLPKGAWEISSDKAIVLPIVQASSRDAFGFLIIGFNPYRLPDEKYSSFFRLVADQVATSFADVHVLEEERKRAESLAEIDRAKTIFFSNISHEFRTPLTLMLSPVEDALNDPRTIPDNKLRMEVVYRNGLRMQKLVNTLLEFSRIEAGRVEGKFERVDICTLTEDLASTFRSAIEKAGMQLEFTCTKITGDVYVDPEMWERIILNLVSNAFKYSKKGKIIVGVMQQGNEVLVSVSDTGVGIPQDQLSKIFERFHRVENTEGRSLEGTGIGLAMVKELVKLHSGTIEVSSEPGKGSVFTISLPMGKQHFPEDKISKTSQTNTIYKHAEAFVEEALKWSDGLPKENELAWNNGTQYKVLLADDNADMLQYVNRLLSDEFTVITAGDGEDAWQKALIHKPHLLLSDIMMPRLDGLGLLKKMRSHPDTKNTPVIFLSARAGEEAKVEGLDAGADDYLVKPFTAKELMVRVTNLVRISEVRRETEKQFYHLFVQAPAIINVFKGADFRFELFHPKNREFFGDVDYTGMPLEEVLPGEDGQRIIAIMREVYSTGQTIRLDEEHIRDRYFNSIYQPWYDIKGKIQGVINFAIEITDAVETKQKIAASEVASRKKIEESERKYRELSGELEAIVEKRTKELKRSNDDLQQFAHVASHDLKEPVRKFRTFINRLKDEYGGQLPDKGKNYLDKMEHASERMSSMIVGVLKYSSINETEQEISTVDVNEIIKHIETDLEVIIQQKNAVINKNNLPSLEGASVLIYQLFYNLINNSLKFSEKQPIINISSSIVNLDGTAYAKIIVDDNGIGFDEGFSEKIFEAFTRLNSKDKYEGTGLGLALCKKIVERHHGTISATSKENDGALFTIHLPLSQTEKRV